MFSPIFYVANSALTNNVSTVIWPRDTTDDTCLTGLLLKLFIQNNSIEHVSEYSVTVLLTLICSRMYGACVGTCVRCRHTFFLQKQAKACVSAENYEEHLSCERFILQIVLKLPKPPNRMSLGEERVFRVPNESFSSFNFSLPSEEGVKIEYNLKYLGNLPPF